MKRLNLSKCQVYLIFVSILVVCFIVFGLFIPIRLVIKSIPSPWYTDIQLSSENTVVKAISLFGISYDADNVNFQQDINGNVTVKAKGLSVTKTFPIIKPKDVTVTYDDTVYVGQSLDISKIHINAMYEDVERRVSDFVVTNDNIPVASSVDIPIKTMFGTVLLSVEPLNPSKIKAVYDKKTKMGDLFDKKNVSVKLCYSDKTTYKIKDFLIMDAPKYISDKVVVNVVTDYGSTQLKIKPSDSQSLIASYDGDIYVGDELDSSKLHLIRKDKSGNEQEINDFTFVNPGVLKTSTELLLHSKFGDSVVVLKPIGIKECIGKLNNGAIEGKRIDVSSIIITYDDNTKREIAVDDVIFTKDLNKFTGGKSDVWFTYHGVYLKFVVYVVPKRIVDMRTMFSDISIECKKYDLSDDDITNIALVCQRLAGDDLFIVAAEASLLANRFELYGYNIDLVQYMFNSGYWGDNVASDISSYEANDDAKWIIRDVLVNGQRSFPTYIDERALSSDIVDVSTSDYVKDVTLLHKKSNDVVYRFYGFISDKSDIAYGYTNDAYSHNNE